MLYIDTLGNNSRTHQTWHVGEPCPVLDSSRVLRFQADGDELDVILEAIRNASSKEQSEKKTLR